MYLLLQFNLHCIGIVVNKQKIVYDRIPKSMYTNVEAKGNKSK